MPISPTGPIFICSSQKSQIIECCLWQEMFHTVMLMKFVLSFETVQSICIPPKCVIFVQSSFVPDSLSFRWIFFFEEFFLLWSAFLLPLIICPSTCHRIVAAISFCSFLVFLIFHCQYVLGWCSRTKRSSYVLQITWITGQMVSDADQIFVCVHHTFCSWTLARGKDRNHDGNFWDIFLQK